MKKYKKTKYQEYWNTNVYNNKQDEQSANKVLGIIVILVCIIIVLDYCTM